MNAKVKERIARLKRNSNPKRSRGKILPTQQGNTAAAALELDDQHALATREAIMDVSSWVRASYDLDPKEFFATMRRYLNEWEEETSK